MDINEEKTLIEIVEVIKEQVKSDEALTSRLNQKDLEDLDRLTRLKVLEYLITGNGEPGLNERVRNLEKFAKEVNLSQIQRDRQNLKIIYFVLSAISLATIALLVKAVWTVLSYVPVAILFLLFL